MVVPLVHKVQLVLEEVRPAPLVSEASLVPLVHRGSWVAQELQEKQALLDCRATTACKVWQVPPEPLEQTAQ